MLKNIKKTIKQSCPYLFQLCQKIHRFFICKFKYASSFILQLDDNSHVLDVGCGNQSPERFKSIKPDVYYVGVDVGDYNNSLTSINSADEYHIFRSDEFDKGISRIPHLFDAVISSHNFEHCNHPDSTLDAMCSKLKSGGRLFMAFPSEKSVHFPSRGVVLTFMMIPHIYSHFTIIQLLQG